MRLGLLVDGERVEVVDLDGGERVDGLIEARLESSLKGGVVASMTWRVSGVAGPGIFEPAEEAPAAPARPLSRAEILAGADLPPDAPPYEDDDRPRPRRAL